MLYSRTIEAERRRGAPLSGRVLAELLAGSARRARRWSLAAREAAMEREARRHARTAARYRALFTRDHARATRSQRDLCFYRVHALRCRDAA